MIKCNHCGAKNVDDAKVCIVCGKEIVKKEEYRDEKLKAPWYSSTWFNVLMLFAFFPLGIFLMWKNKKFPLVIRVVISSFFALLLIRTIVIENDLVKDNEKVSIVSEISYNDIKKEVGLSKESKKGFNSTSNIIYYYGNYKFQIPNYLVQEDNTFRVLEDDDKVSRITINKSHDIDNKATFKKLEEKIAKGNILEELKSVYGKIELLSYQTIKSDAIKGYLFKFIDEKRSTYYEQFVFGDEKLGDWYYLNFKELLDMKYEYADDFNLICKSIDTIKNIKLSKSASSYGKDNYKTVVSDLKKQGFNNITMVPKYDLVFGWLTKDEELDSVMINGNSSFSQGDTFAENSDVVVTYHTFSENETIEEKKDKMIGTYASHTGSVISLYPKNAVYYDRNNGKYYDDLMWAINDDQVTINFNEENYKVYTEYSFVSSDTYTFTSTNEKWLTQEFLKVDGTDKMYSIDQYNKILTSSKIIKRMKLEDLHSMMKMDKYLNIEIEPIYDIYFGVLVKEGDIEKVSLDGETSFDSYLDYPVEVNVKISYHTSYNNKPDEDSNKASIENVASETTQNVLSGWQKEGDYWYYYNNGKKEKSKFIEEYYLGADGRMVTNKTISIGGKKYKFDNDGKYIIVEESNSTTETKQAKKRRGIFDDPDVRMNKFIKSMCEQQYSYGYKISGLSVEEISDGVLDGQCKLSIKNSSGVWGEYILHCVADFNKEKLITWDVR